VKTFGQAAFLKAGDDTTTAVKRLPTRGDLLSNLLSKSEVFSRVPLPQSWEHSVFEWRREPAKILANTGFRGFPQTIVFAATACDDTAAFPNNQLSRP
jgi:hypothetical protein